MKVDHLRLATTDLETDPFKFGNMPEPFLSGFYYTDDNGFGQCLQFWGDDCVKDLFGFLEREALGGRKYLIYAHNGGKFDFFYFFPYLTNPIRVINGRIVEAKIKGGHVLRDSYSIMPVALAQIGKIEIDIEKLHRDKRDKHRAEILAYHKGDLVELYKACTEFRQRFGTKLTVGAAAMAELRKWHDFAELNEREDEQFRQYFHGGRVECFASGILRGPWQVYDVTSMYPYVMAHYEHPAGDDFDYMEELPTNEDGSIDFSFPFFVEFLGTSKGALPQRLVEELTFPNGRGIFRTTSHELQVALKYELVEIEQVCQVIVANQSTNFKKFVDHFFAEKAEGKRNKDVFRETFAKFMLNSCYGKFAQNPDNFRDWKIITDPFEEGDGATAAGYEIYSRNPYFELWTRPAAFTGDALYNVAIGASITGAARAVLLEALVNADTPIYCDTDSIVCRALTGVPIGNGLGEWKHEATADVAAIAGKKLYALWNDRGNRERYEKQGGSLVKRACKGVYLTTAEVARVARGLQVTSRRAAPNFSLRHGTRWIERRVNKTAKPA